MRNPHKKSPRTTLSAALAAALLLPLAWAPGAYAAGTVSESDPATEPGSFTEQNLGADRTEENYFYRIPALVHLGDGVVITAWDARPGSAADAPNPNSIVMRRSTDNGTTWSEMSTIAAGFTGSSTEGKYGYSDPSFVYDEQEQKLFAFFVYSKDQSFQGSGWGNDDTDRQVLSAAVAESTDGGLSWSEPRLITDVVKPGNSSSEVGAVRGTFATSGAGIQLTRGDYAGRLIQQYAGDVVQADGSRTYQAYSVYSDDHGATWQRGEFTGTSMDENKVVELSDGRVMLNSRDSAGGGYRKVAISTDGGHSYSAVTQDTELPDPTNNAHVTQMFPGAAAGNAESKKLLYTGSNSQTGRENVSARVSCDDGATWPGLRTIRRGFSAYSVASALADGQFGVFYEGSYTDSMEFASFDEDWLNYVCAPLQAEDFNADAGSTQSVEVTITNQEAEPISGTLQLVDSANFSADPAQLPDLAAGESTTLTLQVKVDEVSNGAQTLQLQFTDADGKMSQGSVRATIAGREVTGLEVTGERADSARDLAANPYAEGDALPYTFVVKNSGNIAQWVVPTEGNFSPFAAKPVGESSPAGNCRYSSLAAGASYTCATPRHTVSAAELADGFFVPSTHWTAGRIGAYTTVVNDYQITGDEVDLLVRDPKLSIEVAEPVFKDTDGDGFASRGDTVSYQATLSNDGNVRLTDLTLGGQTLEELAAGQTQTVTLTRQLSDADVAAGTLAASKASASAANGLKSVTAQYTLGELTLQTTGQDNETSAPGQAALSHNNGHDTGLADGDYTVTANLWWGVNASQINFLEDGQVISRQKLSPNTPAAQQASVDISGKANGTYTYQAELVNAAGTTKTTTLTVTVKDANPGTPVLTGSVAHGKVTLETNMWWGTNATGYQLLENGEVVDEQQLNAATPSAQQVRSTLTDREPGTYEYQAVLTNAAGQTESKTLKLTVN